MSYVLRFLVLMLAVGCLCAAERTTPVTMDDLYGRWQPDAAAMDAAMKKEAVDALKPGEEWTLTLTPRVGRLMCGDVVLAGLWRLDDATPKGGTIIIEPKGGEAHRFTAAFDGKHLILTGENLPAKMPFAKAK